VCNDDDIGNVVLLCIDINDWYYWWYYYWSNDIDMICVCDIIDNDNENRQW